MKRQIHFSSFFSPRNCRLPVSGPFSPCSALQPLQLQWVLSPQPLPFPPCSCKSPSGVAFPALLLFPLRVENTGRSRGSGISQSSPQGHRGGSSGTIQCQPGISNSGPGSLVDLLPHIRYPNPEWESGEGAALSKGGFLFFFL